MTSDPGTGEATTDRLGLALRLPAGLGDAVALFVSLRIAFGVVALYLWWKGGLPGPCHFEFALNGWLTHPPIADEGAAFPLVGVWQRWDACWYSKIATFGYEPAEMSANFWPLFPVLMGMVSRVLGGAVALAGLTVSAVAYVAAMTGLHRLVSRDFDPETARRTVLFVSIFPSAFFLFAPFTEALFLALSVWCIALARERQWALAALLGLLAGLTRIQGVFLVLPIGWEALVAAGLTAWRPWQDLAPPRIAWGPLVRGGLAAVAPAVGFGAFIGYTAMVVGRTPIDLQDAWGGREFFAPWDVAAAAWQWTLDHQDPLQFLNLALLVVVIAVIVAGVRRIPTAYTLAAVPQLVLLATRIQPTPLTSTSRYLLVIFPAFVILALIPWRRVRIGWALTSVLLLGLLVQSFLRGEYVA